jgi:rhodanese-related sulfurtransferase
MTEKIMYTTSEANELAEQGRSLAVDVRDAQDYAKGHIPGAVSLPEMFTTLSMTSAEGLQELQDIFVPLFRKAGIRKDQMVLVYEDSLVDPLRRIMPRLLPAFHAGPQECRRDCRRTRPMEKGWPAGLDRDAKRSPLRISKPKSRCTCWRPRTTSSPRSKIPA